MKKKLVIIGGGFAGVEAAARLQNDFHVTLVDKKDYFECYVGAPLAITEPEDLEGMTVLYNQLLENTTIVTGEVTEVTPKEIKLKDNTHPYDYLIISSGSSYHQPIKPSAEQNLTHRKETFQNWHDQLDKAKSVIVIGGGPVGVEVATEVITTYPIKKLTLLESGPHLLSRLHRQARDYGKTFLQEKGAELILNEKLEGKEDNTYITDKGTKIEADIAFNCIGIQSNTAFLKKHFSAHLDERKRVKVNEYLQLSGYENIFALGDCNNVNEEKLAINAKRHATIVVENIQRLERNAPLHPYHISKLFTTLIGCGRSNAIMATPWFAYGGFIPGQFKSMEVPMLMKTLTWSYPKFFWEFY